MPATSCQHELDECSKLRISQLTSFNEACQVFPVHEKIESDSKDRDGHRAGAAERERERALSWAAFKLCCSAARATGGLWNIFLSFAQISLCVAIKFTLEFPHFLLQFHLTCPRLWPPACLPPCARTRIICAHSLQTILSQIYACAAKFNCPQTFCLFARLAQHLVSSNAATASSAASSFSALLCSALLLDCIRNWQSDSFLLFYRMPLN